MKKIIAVIIVVLLIIYGFVSFNNNNNESEKETIEVSASAIQGMDVPEIPLYGNTSWAITQWGNNDQKQMMSFTIEGNKGGLVLVDGGYEDSEFDSEVIVSKIKEHGNQVDAWIITHFDDDHCGQFLNIIKNYPEFKINRFYVQDAPTDIDVLLDNRDDVFDAYETYLGFNISQIVKVHSGDKFKNIIGLDMHVLSSYSPWIDEKMDNLLNNGSVIFKLYGQKESMLFCGDAESKLISDYLFENYSDELESDYLQVGHHGNNLFPNEFYDKVNPKVAFLCMPDWIMNAKIKWHTVKDIKAYLEKKGCMIFSYNTTPNQIIMH